MTLENSINQNITVTNKEEKRPDSIPSTDNKPNYTILTQNIVKKKSY